MEKTYHRTKREIEYLLSHQELLSASEKQELLESLRSVELDLALQNREAERDRLLGNYFYFLCQAWAWVDNSSLVANWHIKLMCDYLQALRDRSPFRDLIINVPPGCSKSLNTMVIWPAWVFARNPAERLLCASYDGDLVKKQAVDSKRLMLSDWYQSFFGDRVQIRADVDTQVYFETTAGGSRFSTTPRGRATGRHPSLIACDDLTNPRQSDSKKEREAVLEWWDGTMETRGSASDINRARVVIGQRLHEKDVPGHILANDVDHEWARLILPMRFEPGRMPDIGIGTDPRKKPGELLDPVRFPEAVVKRTERRLGPHGTAGQLQQRPTSKESEKFKIDQITFIPIEAVPLDRISRFKRFWDRAGTKGGGDYSVGTLGGVVAGPVPKVFILDQVRGQWSVDQVVDQMALWARLDQARFGFSKMETVFERGAADAGIQAARDTIRRMPGRRVRSIRPTGSKEVRAEPLANAIAAGEVYFVTAPWNQDCIDEMRLFPKGEHDDCVDSLSGLYAALVGGSMFEEGIDADDEDEAPERFVRCRNPKCNRYASADLDHCCECCLNAEAEGRTIDESDHSGECAYRHSQLFAAGDWSPNDEPDR